MGPDPADAGANGQCNFDAWVDQCPSSTCVCYNVASPKVTGNAGGGPLQASNVFVTVDTGVNPATEPAINGDVPNPKCNLLFGVMTLTSPKSGETQTVNLVGTTCKHVIGISARNSGGNHDTDLLSGGWGISNDPAPNPADESGWGTFSGTVKQSTGALSLKLSGDLSK